MPSIAEKFVFEFDIEAKSTLGLLEVLPEDKMSWKPHEKSFSLGGLVHHIVTIPSVMIEVARVDSFEVPEVTPETCVSKEEAIRLHHENLQFAKDELPKFEESFLMSDWKLTKGDQILMNIPRVGVIHSFFFNHYYHHRGQLTVYLRLLNVALPSVYGPTADMNPFA